MTRVDLTEICREAHESAAAERLDDPAHACDLSASPVDTPEAVDISGPALHFFLHVVSQLQLFQCNFQACVKVRI